MSAIYERCTAERGEVGVVGVVWFEVEDGVGVEVVVGVGVEGVAGGVVEVEVEVTK